ncbi:hypothetical protein HDC92_004022 [Pedobacter sp. AK017]|uniref:hypothetical protein n=1 Tax=Pedobacter sp. AK017 TaxID=2723073 RepID=UPI00161DAAF4|nr:hypothetical protein [Pedobacter sp. AK017]MBB5440322.1 hypothetical protein [Pedobacter sp. AK017]
MPVFHCLLSAQQKDSTGKTVAVKDTGGSFVRRMQAFAKVSAKSSADDFAADKAAIAQNRIIDEIKKAMHIAKVYLSTGIDILGTLS